MNKKILASLLGTISMVAATQGVGMKYGASRASNNQRAEMGKQENRGVFPSPHDE